VTHSENGCRVHTKHEFLPPEPFLRFRNEHAQPTSLGPKLMFGVVSRNFVAARHDEDITMSTTTPAAPPHQAPLPSLAGPITRARARDLNFVMLLKNEGPEE
jgi:hypothetical protein